MQSGLEARAASEGLYLCNSCSAQRRLPRGRAGLKTLAVPGFLEAPSAQPAAYLLHLSRGPPLSNEQKPQPCTPSGVPIYKREVQKGNSPAA